MPKKHRVRPSFVCTNCKKRKIKCNRGRPCKHCLLSGIGDTCHYVTPDLSHLIARSPDVPSKTTNIAQIYQEITDLKAQIARLETASTAPTDNDSDCTIADGDDTDEGGDNGEHILEAKFPLLKKVVLYRYHDHLNFFGSMAARSLFENNARYLHFRKTSGQFLDSETAAWKETHKAPVDAMDVLTSSADRDVVMENAKNFFVPHFTAFMERLKYFEDHLNSLLFSGCIPMSIVYQSVQDMVIYNPEGLELRDLRTHEDYAKLALVLSIASITLSVTKYDTEMQFEHYLEDEDELMTRLALKLLKLSKMRHQANSYALFALLLIRKNRFLAESAEADIDDGFSSFRLFQVCTDQCFQLGMHRNYRHLLLQVRDPYELENLRMPPNEHLWAYLRMIDALYSCDLGTPTLINNQFCDCPPVDEFTEGFISRMYDVADTINSAKAISIKDAIDCADRLNAFASQIGTFGELLQQELKDDDKRDALAFRFIAKIRMMEVYHRICLFIKSNLEDLDFFRNERLLTEENIKILAEITQLLARRTITVALTFMSVIKVICSSDTIFGHNGGKYVVMLKPYFSQVIRNCVQNFVECFFMRDTRLKKAVLGLKDSEMLMENDMLGHSFWKSASATPVEGDVSSPLGQGVLTCDIKGIEIMEKDTYTPIQELKLLDSCSMVRNLVWDPKLMIGFMADFYNGVAENEALATSYTFFIKFKYLVMLCSLLQTLVEITLDKGQSSSDQDVWMKAIQVTREKLESKLNMGTVDKRMNWNGSEQVSNFLDSMDEKSRAAWDPQLAFEDDRYTENEVQSIKVQQLADTLWFTIPELCGSEPKSTTTCEDYLGDNEDFIAAPAPATAADTLEQNSAVPATKIPTASGVTISDCRMKPSESYQVLF